MPPCLKSVGFALALIGAGTIAPFVPSLNPHARMYAQAQTVSPSTVQPPESIQRLLETAKQHFRQAEFKQAIALYQQALSVASQDKNSDAQLEALLYLLDMDLANGQYPSAEAKIQQALKLAQQVGNRAREAEVLAGLSAFHRLQGDYSQALDNARKAVEIARQVGDRRVEARSRLMLGIALYFQPDYPKALEALQQAINLAQADQNQDQVASVLNWVALTHAALKDVQLAEKTIQQQQQLSQNIGFRLAEYYGLWVIASIQQGNQQLQQALPAYQQTLAIAQAANNLWFQRSVLLEIGGFYVSQKQMPKALEAYQQALMLAKTIDIAAVADAQNRIGVGYYRAKQYPQAVEAFQQALAIYQKLSNQSGIAQVWKNLGDGYKQQKQYPQALECYQQALTLYRQLKNPQQEIQVLSSIGYTHLFDSITRRTQGDYTQAKISSEQGLATFQQQLEVARGNRDRPQELWALKAIAQAYGNIGQAIHVSGNYAGAVKPYEQSLPIWQQAQTLATDLKDAEASQEITQEIFQTRRGIVNAYNALNQYAEALEQTRQMRDLLQATGKPDNEQSLIFLEHNIYSGLANRHNTPEQYDQFLDYSQKAIALAEKLQPPGTELQYWGGIAQVYRFRGQYAQALAIHQRVLARSREVQNREQEIFALLNIGIIYKEQANYAQALAHYEQALQLSRGYTTKESIALISIASIYVTQGNYAQALAIYQDLLVNNQKTAEQLSAGVTPQNIRWLCQERNDFYSGKDPQAKPGLSSQGCAVPDALPTGYIFDSFKFRIATWRGSMLHAVATNFNNLGAVYDDQGNYPKAQELYQQSLAINRQQQDRAGEAKNLNNLGVVALNQGNYAKATQFIQQALKIAVKQDNRSEITYHANLGKIASDQGNYVAALEIYQTVLAVAQKIGQRAAEATILGNIAEVHRYKGDYAKALTNYQQALKIHQEIGQPTGTVSVLLHLGTLHRQLGEYSLAIATHQQALATAQKIGTKPQEAAALLALASDYRDQGNLDASLKHYQQALAIAQAIGNRYVEASTLQGLGRLYLQKAQSAKAASIFQQALIAQQQMGVRADAAATLSFLGQAQTQLGKATEAQSALQEALVVAQETGDRPTQAQALSHLGDLFAKQNQPELAIAFYKQSVNTYESIRRNLRVLSQEQQQSYAETVANTYRQLANLLIEQKRLPEAQAVMELLKLRELRDYTRDAGIEGSGISLANIEAAALKQILQQFTTVANFTQAIAKCEQEKCTNLEQLYSQRGTLNRAVDRELEQQRVILAKHFATEKTLTIDNLNAQAFDIINAQADTALIYPLVLKDKVQFLLILKAGNGAISYRPFETNVKVADLSNTIQTFREQLGKPGSLSTLQTTSQQLYTWLIQPLEAELKAAKIKHIVFAPDSITRYIPFAALYNGNHYLIQRYSVATVTAASLTNVTEAFPQPSANQPFVLAMGASVFPNLSSLDYVPMELNAIVRTKDAKDTNGIYPGTEFLNQSFSYQALQQHLKDHRILHIATHGQAVPGRPDDSYLVSGSGNPITTEQIRDLVSHGLRNIHLVVLSACETAVGDRASDGMEIPGLSHSFLSRQVKSVMASLWSVNDTSTALMMQQFYKHLSDGKTKAQALQEAQLSLLKGDKTAKDLTDRATLVVKGQKPTRPSGAIDFKHPYFWAPFILIGNSR